MNASLSVLTDVLDVRLMCADAMRSALFAAMQVEIGCLMTALVSDLPEEARRGLQADAERLSQRFVSAWLWVETQDADAWSQASQSSAA